MLGHAQEAVAHLHEREGVREVVVWHSVVALCELPHKGAQTVRRDAEVCEQTCFFEHDDDQLHQLRARVPEALE